MDARSFGSVWFWIVIVLIWGDSGRVVLGVPADVVNRARRDPKGDAGLALLDWLTLTLPRWRFRRGEGAILLGIGAFALTSLLVLGFGYGLQLAQAASLLGVPLVLLFLMRLRLAQRLWPVMASAQDGRVAPDEATAQVLRLIVRHRRLVLMLSIFAVGATALWGSIWQLSHPNGL